LITLYGRNGFSQDMASIKELDFGSSTQEKLKTAKSLTRILSQLGQHSGVSINYESDLLEDS
jgi:hypothetical protein